MRCYACAVWGGEQDKPLCPDCVCPGPKGPDTSQAAKPQLFKKRWPLLICLGLVFGPGPVPVTLCYYFSLVPTPTVQSP